MKDGEKLYHLAKKEAKREIAFFSLDSIVFLLMIAIGVAIAFSLIFYFLHIKLVSNGIHITKWVDCLYFSVVTMTTLGYGDIYPSSEAGKILVIIEVVIGIIIFGLIVNSVTSFRSRIDAKLYEKSTKNEKICRVLKRIKFCSVDIAFFINNLEQVIFGYNNEGLPPRSHEEVLNAEFDFKQVKNIFNLQLLVTKGIAIPIGLAYFKHLERLKRHLEFLIVEEGMVYYPKHLSGIVENSRYIEVFDARDSLEQLFSCTVNSEMIDLLKKMIIEYDDTRNYGNGNIIYLAKSLHEQMKAVQALLKAIIDLEERIIEDVDAVGLNCYG